MSRPSHRRAVCVSHCRMRASWIAALVSVAVLAGCGGSPTVSASDPVSSPYDGPMSLPVDHGDEASVAERSGAAGRALECDGQAYAGGGADYDSGLAAVQNDATKALENLFEEDSRGETVPDEGYRIERKDGDRVLFSYDVGSRTKVAFIARNGITDFNHDQGWGIEAWAQCDPAELPASFTDPLNTEIWETATGTRVPVTTVTSYQGAEHCDWEDITFLELPDGKAKTWYVRDPRGDLRDFVVSSYDRSAALPKDATDTGLRHDGRQLWVVPAKDAAYLVSTDDTSDVERWPAAKDRIGCA